MAWPMSYCYSFLSLFFKNVGVGGSFRNVTLFVAFKTASKDRLCARALLPPGTVDPQWQPPVREMLIAEDSTVGETCVL